MFKIAKYILGAGLIFGATAASAGGLPQDVIDGVMNSCRPDYHRFCSYVVPGGGRVARCLLDHETELTPSCLMPLKLAYAIEACLPDYNRFCNGVPRGPEALECLADRTGSLNPECQSVVSANARYMEPRHDRYGYNRSPAPNGEAYAYREDRGQDRYADDSAPRYNPYDGGGDGERQYPDNGPSNRDEEEEREAVK